MQDESTATATLEDDIAEATEKAVTTTMVDYDEVNAAMFAERKAAQAVLDDPDATRIAIRRAKRTHQDVTARIYLTNQGLLNTIVGKFTRTASADLVEEYHAAGVAGMVRAVETYDPDLGKFSTWCWKPIQRELLKAVRMNEFSLQPSDFERRQKVIRMQAKLTEELGRKPTNSEIAERSGVAEDSVARITAHRAAQSLNIPVGEDNDTQLGDLLPDENPSAESQVETSLAIAAVEQYALPVLNDQERMVLVRRFGLDGEPEENLADIGKTIGRSREAVRQIEARALSKILHPLVARRIMRHGRN
jgi:RNA polymerase sigma factor (sigma-70 family)